MQTEFPFTLPRGFLDGGGGLHREGHMRLALALDEVESLNDPRVVENEAYLPIVLLSRVIIDLGGLDAISTQVVENLFASDMAYLEDLYLRLNSTESVLVGAVCPHCNQQFQVQVAPLESEVENA